MSIDQPEAAATHQPPAERANGLATYFGVLFAPGDAFATLARVPMWGWACLLGLLITVAAAVVGLPATLHIAQTAQQTAIAQSPADQQQTMRDGIAKVAPYMPSFIVIVALLFPWISWVVTALVVLAGAAIGRGAARFGNAWVLALNANAVAAFGYLIGNVILRLQGAENLTKASDAYAVPSLAMLIHGDAKIAAFLYAFNVINIWYYAVLAVGMQKLMKVGGAVAWATSIVYALILALFAMAFAK